MMHGPMAHPIFNTGSDSYRENAGEPDRCPYLNSQQRGGAGGARRPAP
jgi:hypothetical protein